MKRSALGGILTVTLVVTVLLLGYLYLSKTSSGYRMQEHRYTMSFFEDRIDALDKQRELLLESASDLEEQAAVLRKRVHLVEVELVNMRDRLLSDRKDSRAPFYSWDRFRFTTSSGLIVIAFLVFIWLLYTSSGKGGAPEEEAGEMTPPGDGTLPEGSVLEEEFQPRSDPPSSEPSPDTVPEGPEGAPEPAAAEEGNLSSEEVAEAPAAADRKDGEEEKEESSVSPGEDLPESKKDD